MERVDRKSCSSENLSIGSLLFRKIPFWYYELCSELNEEKEREREREREKVGRRVICKVVYNS